MCKAMFCVLCTCWQYAFVCLMSMYNCARIVYVMPAWTCVRARVCVCVCAVLEIAVRHGTFSDRNCQITL